MNNGHTNGNGKSSSLALMASPERVRSSSPPKLDPIPSASQLPSSNGRTASVQTSVQGIISLDEHMKQINNLRSALAEQRESSKKAEASFEREREVWEDANRRLQELVDGLKNQLAHVQDRRSSSQTRSLGRASGGSFGHQHSVGGSSAATTRSVSFADDNLTSPRVWEPSPSIPPTRTFSDDAASKHPDVRLSSIAEDVSPRAQDSAHDGSVIREEDTTTEKEEKFDGIALRPRASRSSFHAQMVTSLASPPPVQSPMRSPMRSPTGNHPEAGLLVPDEILKRDAGHTPLAKSDGMTMSSSALTPTQENPYAPASTARPPTERSNSYFPEADPSNDDIPTNANVESSRKDSTDNATSSQPSRQSDHSLQGPLALENDDSKDAPFLDAVNDKLLQQARNILSSPKESESSGNEENEEDPGRPEAMDDGPRLRIKSSMNFGSQLGSGRLGPLSS